MEHGGTPSSVRRSISVNGYLRFRRCRTQSRNIDGKSWKLAQIPGEEWQHAHITAFGWTVSEQLMLLLEDGRLFVFSIYGTRIAETHLFDQVFVDLVSFGLCTELGCIAATRTGRM